MTPILPPPLKILVIAFFLIIKVFNFIVKKPPFKSRYFIVNSSLYLVYIASLLHIDNFSYGLRKLEVGASLIVFPLGFALVSKDALNDPVKQLKVFLCLCYWRSGFKHHIDCVVFNEWLCMDSFYKLCWFH